MAQNFNGPVTVDGNEIATSATIERLIPDIIANTTGSGNAVTAISVDDSNKHKLNITKGSTFLTTHQSLTDLGITATAAELNVLDGITATTTELNYTDEVTSNIQTQLNGKLGTSAKAADSDKLDGNDSSYFATASSLANKADKASVTAGTNCKITYNTQGIVTAGTSLSASDIPNLAASKITSGTFDDARIASASTWNAKQDALPITTTAGKVLKSTSTAGTVEWGDAGGNFVTLDTAQNITANKTFTAADNSLAISPYGLMETESAFQILDTTSDYNSYAAFTIDYDEERPGWVYNSSGTEHDTTLALSSDNTYQTTAPTGAIADGGIHIVYLTSDPETKYDGYIYLIAEE